MLFWFMYFVLIITCAAQRKTYLSLERPSFTDVNTKYIQHVNATARRHNRRDPIHYFNLNFELLVYVSNNVSVDYYFYQWLTNRYQRSFVEMHFSLCDLIHKDLFFGSSLKQGRLADPCPFPPGAYNLVNMTIPTAAIPRGFPFTKGRIFCNLTIKKTSELMLAGYIDMELKQISSKTNRDLIFIE